MNTPIFEAVGATAQDARNAIGAVDAAYVSTAISTALVAYDWKPSVECRARAAEVPINLAAPGATIDGIGMVPGARFFTDGQTGVLGGSHIDNGLYVWNGPAVPATRATDLAAGSHANGATFKVNEGTFADLIFTCTTDPPDVVGTNALSFALATFVSTITNDTHGALGFQTSTPAQHHSDAVASTSPGFMSGADKAKLDGYSGSFTAGAILYGNGTSYVELAPPGAPSMSMHTGSGGTNIPAYLTIAGGGASANMLFSVDAAGTGLQIAALTDLQHGNLSGGSAHAVAVAATSDGFMSGADKAKLDAYPATYTAGAILYGNGTAYVELAPPATVSIVTHTGTGGTDIPALLSLAGIGTDAYLLVQANAAGNDYILGQVTNQGHGALGFQTLAAIQHHSNAVPGVSPGFMSAADKTKLDALPTINAFMGDGSDGAAAFTAAGAPVTGTTNVGGVYELARDVNYTTVTIENGAVVNCNGTAGAFFLRANVSITNLGIIHANGADGADSGVGGGAGGTAGVAGTLRAGTAGGAGNNAGSGTNGAADVTGLGMTGGSGGAGGNDVGANAGGTAGAVTVPTVIMGDWHNAWAALQSFLPGYNAGGLAFPQGGSGGGGGGSGVTNVGTTSNGGGGGAGGGILKIAAPLIDNSGTGVIMASGGKGGAGGTGTALNDDGGGGGGGGGGGIVLLFHTAYTGNAASANGGTPGIKGFKEVTGTGADGTGGMMGMPGLVRHFTV